MFSATAPYHKSRPVWLGGRIPVRTNSGGDQRLPHYIAVFSCLSLYQLCIEPVGARGFWWSRKSPRKVVREVQRTGKCDNDGKLSARVVRLSGATILPFQPRKTSFRRRFSTNYSGYHLIPVSNRSSLIRCSAIYKSINSPYGPGFNTF